MKNSRQPDSSTVMQCTYAGNSRQGYLPGTAAFSLFGLSVYDLVLFCCFFMFLSEIQAGPPVQLAAMEDETVRVACIGGSVTFGYGIENRGEEAFPAVLQDLLGHRYEVRNFGVRDATVLQKGQVPYCNSQEFAQALAFGADFVVLELGLDDADFGVWPIYRDDFTRDYLQILHTLKQQSNPPRIWICVPTPIFSQCEGYKAGIGTWHREVQDAIRIVARVSEAKSIDLDKALCHRPDVFPDHKHTDRRGAALIAQRVYSAITGDFGGLAVPEIFGSNMVLQRRQRVPVWGRADAGQSVEVIFGNEERHTKADDQGRWNVAFPAQEAGGPYQILINTRSESKAFDNVMVGEVWICSGQSNMDFKLKYAQNGEEAITHASKPDIRLYALKSVDRTITEQWDAELLQQINEKKYRGGTWLSCTPESAAEFSAVAYYFGSALQEALGVPIGLIDNSKGGSPAEAWISRDALESNPYISDILVDWKHNPMIQQWCRDRAIFNLANADNPIQRHPYEPTYLFEALVLPVAGFPLAGAIWYQGEANAQNVALHEKLFPELVASWRDTWESDFPFYYVQLSSFYPPGWPRFRDSQRRLLGKVSNTGMAVSSDVGDSLDIHPRRKREVGERLALWALSKNYKKDIQYSGPLYDTAIFAGRKVTVLFNHADGLKTSDGQSPGSFEVAGEDKVYTTAIATIRGDVVEVYSPEVRWPRYVRYGWQPYSKGNVVNAAGLPASTFSSEFEH